MEQNKSNTVNWKDCIEKETYQVPEGELRVICTLSLHNGYKVKASSPVAATIGEFGEVQETMRTLAKATANCKLGELLEYSRLEKLYTQSK